MLKPTEPAPSYSKMRLLCEMYYGFRPNKPIFTPDDYPDLTGKTALVTGSNSGIGLETTKALYKKNCDVIMVVRNEDRGNTTRDSIMKEISGSKGNLYVVSGCDYSDLSLIKAVSKKIENILKDKPLSIIIHNAGLMASVADLTSEQGYELMFQTNVLGPQLLQHFLDPLFLKNDSDLKRIVWVSSGAHLLGPNDYGIFWEHPTFEGVPIENRPSALVLYGQSKCGNIFQAKAWATRNKKLVDEIGCVSTSCYPGNLNTNLQRDWSWIRKAVFAKLMWDAKYGSYTELYGALYPGLDSKDQGAYICPFGEIHDPREDIMAGLKNGTDLVFWDYVEEVIKPFF